MQRLSVSPFCIGVGYINLSLSCIIVCTIVFWIVRLVKFTVKSRKEFKLVKCQSRDVFQARERTNKRTHFHKGLLLLLILSMELIQKSTACVEVSTVELYSVMQHTPAVLELRAISNTAILGMLSTISLALTYLMNAYGERGDRKNFKRSCQYSVLHCALVLILSCFVRTFLLGYLLYELFSVIDFVLIVRNARGLNFVLRVRTAEAYQEFGWRQSRIHEKIQKRYQTIIIGVILCLLLFVLGVLLHRISIILGVFLNYPCFLLQAYSLDVWIHLSDDQINALEFLSKSLLISFYILILIFGSLFLTLNAAAILTYFYPTLGVKNVHSDKRNREFMDPLLKRYHRSLY